MKFVPHIFAVSRSLYLHQPFLSSFPCTHMPDHPNLTEGDLDDLLAYFHYMKKIRD